MSFGDHLYLERQPASQADSVSDKLLREAHLLLGGTCEGIAERATSQWKQPSFWVKVGESAAIGLAMAYGMRSGGLGSFLARGAGAAMSVQFMQGMLDVDRLKQMGSACADTLRSNGNYSQDYLTFKRTAGALAFDTLIVGGLSSTIGSRLGYWRFGQKATMSKLSSFEAEGQPKSSETARSEGATGACNSGADLAVSLPNGLTALINSDKSVAWLEAKPGPGEEAAKTTGTNQKQRQVDAKLQDGTRVIVKEDRTVVFVSSNGDTTVVRDGVKVTKSGRVTVTEKPDGTVSERKVLLPEEKPLNVASMSVEPIAKKMSNFGQRPFVIDGMSFQSIEGFYNYLRINDPQKRAEVTTLWGPEARRAGRDYRQATQGEYLGETFELGSQRHHDIIKRAIKTSLEQHGELAAEFIQTYPRPIVHNTGRPESPNAKYPATIFCQHLTEIRQELLEQQGLAIGKADESMSRSDNQLMPIAQIIAGIKDPVAIENHDLQAYRKWFESSDRRGRSYFGGGADSVIIDQGDGNLLKLSHRMLQPEMGNRPFDLPILERGAGQVDGVPVTYFVTPKWDAARPEDLAGFFETLARLNYHFRDPSLNQLVRKGDQVRLCDPWAVVKLPEDKI